jgi:hypothetical protein
MCDVPSTTVLFSEAIESVLVMAWKCFFIIIIIIIIIIIV